MRVRVGGASEVREWQTWEGELACGQLALYETVCRYLVVTGGELDGGTGSSGTDAAWR